MQSNRQRRSQITQKRAAKKRTAELEALARRSTDGVRVNPASLRPTNSYGTPKFAERGFYLDQPFTCKDCGKAEVWTAHQQKWWYEVAQGDVWTTAIRCRACRKKEAARKAEARRVHLEGVERKARA